MPAIVDFFNLFQVHFKINPQYSDVCKVCYVINADTWLASKVDKLFVKDLSIFLALIIKTGVSSSWALESI